MLSISPNLLYTVVNLLVLYLLMKKFLFAPVLALLDKRAKGIEDDIHAAQVRKQEAESLRVEYHSHLREAQTEATQILAEARKQAEAMQEQKRQEAQVEAERILSQAQKQIAMEREEMLRQLKGEMALLALSAAAKVGVGSLDAESDKRMMEAFFAEVGDAQ